MTEGADAAESHDANAKDKHVHYEDHFSSASDDDMNAVEVTFESNSPYRRKSSLVTSDAISPKIAKRSPKPLSTQCLVHKFLEGHRKEYHDSRTKHSIPNSHQGHEDVSKEVGLDSYVEPKGKDHAKTEKVSLIEPESDNSTDCGQFDEKSWKTAVTKSKSELDLAGNEQEGLHSRLLTKKQLSEMAWGVRELSRRLGSVRLKFKAQTIFLLTKIYDHDLIPKTREVAKWLLSEGRDVQYTVYVQSNLKDNKQFDVPGLMEELRQDYIKAGKMNEDTSIDVLSRRLRYWKEDICRLRPHTFDFVITMGGDGTVLYASWLFQRIVPPVLSFSLGSLGFLTKFDFIDYQNILTTAFRDGVTVSLRLRFEGTVMRSQKRSRPLLNGSTDRESDHRKRDLIEELIGEEKDDEHTHRPDGTYEILNEVVIDRGPNPTMSYTEIFGDDEHFTSVLADGVCVSTPTGSTAYNLAAGGSLCHPENPVMLVTSICAHTLSFRPIILPDTIVLRIGVPYDVRTNSWASFDGRERIEMYPGDYVTISASRFPFASVQPPGRRSENWVNSISGKLGWNTRQKQKNEGYRPWDK
ncbi:ATP-NAD kinase [Biscogniauxia mediterranea]|nr:ATP-NAD kinase [Biscogniauxia mediterranea]